MFWLYVAGYTAGRTWIEALRVDTANHFFGIRLNVFTSVLVFLLALVMLYLLRRRTREDPARLWGRAPRGQGDEPAVVPVGAGSTPLPEHSGPTDPTGRPDDDAAGRDGTRD